LTAGWLVGLDVRVAAERGERAGHASSAEASASLARVRLRVVSSSEALWRCPWSQRLLAVQFALVIVDVVGAAFCLATAWL
jgi:head-tail adaptor